MAFKQLSRRPVTDIFTSDSCIDRRKCRRTVPMKVLVLGLGRTGTASMRAALKRLGYQDTYHMMSASIENSPDCLMWQDAIAAKYEGRGEFGRKQWDQLLGHCQAVCDWPAAAFAEELIQAYPDAKVILTNRPVDSWHRSTMKTVWWRVQDPELRVLAHLDWAASMYHPMLQAFFDNFFRGNFPEKGKSIYLQHYDHVRSLVRKENLLEYSISHGWGPLCEFLGDNVPCEQFPNINDASTFVARSRRRNRMMLLNVTLRYLIYVMLAVLLLAGIVHVVGWNLRRSTLM